MLLEEENINIPAWLSFNSKDGINVVSGDSITECVAAAESSNKVVAVGINCTPPRFIRDLVLSIKKVSVFCFTLFLFDLFLCLSATINLSYVLANSSYSNNFER